MSGGMSQHPAGTAQGLAPGDAGATGRLAGRRAARTWRGLFALSMLFVISAAGYAAVLWLFDTWYKGGWHGQL